MATRINVAFLSGLTRADGLQRDETQRNWLRKLWPSFTLDLTIHENHYLIMEGYEQ